MGVVPPGELFTSPRPACEVTFMGLTPALTVAIGLFHLCQLQAAEPDSLRNLRVRGAEAYRRADWATARASFSEGLAESRRLNLPSAEGRFLSNLGGLNYASFRTAEALQFFTLARDIGRKNRDTELEQIATLNMATVYARYEDWAKALEILEGVSAPPPAIRSQYLLHRAIYLYRSLRYEEADDAFRAASAEQDAHTLGRIWENWGLSFLARHQNEVAERCFLESFRIRFLNKNPEYQRLFLHLSHLARERRDSTAAIDYGRRAVRAAESGASNYPAWAAHHAEGRAHQLAGDTTAAIAAYRRAVKLARRTRADVLPLDQIVVSTESSLFTLYADFVETAFPVAAKDRESMAEVWSLAEENRRASLRLSTFTPATWEARFTPDYREALARLQRLESKVLTTPEERRKREALRSEILSMEGRLGAAGPSVDAENPLRQLTALQSILPADEALVSFQIGEKKSHAWLVTNREFKAAVLPGKAELSRQVNSFRHAMLKFNAREKSSSDCFLNIFGELSPLLSTKAFWTLIVDGPLFDLPVAALVLPDGNLVGDRHAVVMVPAIPSRGSRPTARGAEMVAFADPIYNSADPRRARPVRPASFSNELPRLPGTSREARALSQTWQGPVALHLGGEASRDMLLRSLERSPAVLHLATHVVAAKDQPDQARIALSLREDAASPDLVGAAELLTMRHQIGLVVMAGCWSGQGKPVPGAGLVGLSRAWLISGAEGVLASQWPVPDDSGELVTAFYRYLQRLERGPPHRRWALALQSAQREMRQSSDWRSQAPYWASYFLMMRSERSVL